MTFNPSDYIPHALGVGSAIIAFWALQQSSELSVADYAERIRSNELSIQASTERLRLTADDLEKLATRIEGEEDQKLLRELRARLGELETELEALKKRPAATGPGAGPTAEEVAAILARDYAESLRGPAGPKGDRGEPGPQGAQGPKGDAGSGSAGATGQARGDIVIDANFTSNYEELYSGGTKMILLGCSGPGTRVECNLLLEAVDGKDQPNFFASASRVALPSAEWVTGKSVTLGEQNGARVDASLISGVPSKLSIAFNLPSGGHDGLLALEVVRHGYEPVLWRNIVLEK